MMSKVSLIPYLEPGDGKFYLNITSLCPPAGGEEYSRYSFEILNDTESFSRLFKAQIVSDGGQPISQLFLLAQQDSYRYKPEGIWPLSNADLDKCWQQTFSYIDSADNLQNRFFPLKGTTSPEGKLIPFQSLFLCSYKNRFFHPPCPTCGKNLELCENDQLLSSKGLSAYGTTLRRYLYCPSCSRSSSVFYTYIREDAEPLIVRNLHEMVQSWRDIAAGRIESRTLPCTNCPELAACYGERILSSARIIPFIFYPSYILAFEASSVSALDFLQLISGAAIDEIIPPLKENKQHSRLNCLLEWQQVHSGRDLFLRSGEAEQFLEILYLKLSFLDDVARIFLTPGATPVPFDISTAINCIYVNLQNYSGLLPSLWSFRTNLFTVGFRGTEADSLPTSHPSQARYCLGIIWFLALVKNRKQSVHVIKNAVSQILNRPAESSLEGEPSVLAPENIFWNPDTHPAKDIPEKWRVIWTQVISLGEYLVKGDRHEYFDGSGKKFFADLEKIRQEIKQLLFGKEKGKVTTFSKQPTDSDAEIHRILSGMFKEWQGDTSYPHPPAQSREETLTETVVLTKKSGSGLIKSIKTAPEKCAPIEEAEEELQETVIQKRNATTLKTSESVRNAQPPKRTESIDEKNNIRDAEEELQKTVILKSNTRPLKTSGDLQNTHPPIGTKSIDEKYDIPETVILKPSSTKDKQK